MGAFVLPFSPLLYTWSPHLPWSIQGRTVQTNKCQFAGLFWNVCRSTPALVHKDRRSCWHSSSASLSENSYPECIRMVKVEGSIPSWDFAFWRAHRVSLHVMEFVARCSLGTLACSQTRIRALVDYDEPASAVQALSLSCRMLPFCCDASESYKTSLCECDGRLNVADAKVSDVLPDPLSDNLGSLRLSLASTARSACATPDVPSSGPTSNVHTSSPLLVPVLHSCPRVAADFPFCTLHHPP